MPGMPGNITAPPPTRLPYTPHFRIKKSDIAPKSGCFKTSSRLFSATYLGGTPNVKPYSAQAIIFMNDEVLCFRVRVRINSQQMGAEAPR